MRSYTGADGGGDTGHNLAIAAVELRENYTQNKIDLEVLESSDNRNRYSLEISNQFQALVKESDNNVNEMWKNIKNTVHEAAETISGRPKRKKNKKWFDEACQNELKSKRKLRSNAMNNLEMGQEHDEQRKKTKRFLN